MFFFFDVLVSFDCLIGFFWGQSSMDANCTFFQAFACRRGGYCPYRVPLGVTSQKKKQLNWAVFLFECIFHREGFGRLPSSPRSLCVAFAKPWCSVQGLDNQKKTLLNCWPQEIRPEPLEAEGVSQLQSHSFCHGWLLQAYRRVEELKAGEAAWDDWSLEGWMVFLKKNKKHGPSPLVVVRHRFFRDVKWDTKIL